MNARQLILDLDEGAGGAPGVFVDGPVYEAARAHLAAPEVWPRGGLILTGPRASGKTRLAKDWARLHGAVILPGGDVRGDAAGRFAASAALVVDPLDAVTDAEALFHLINDHHSRGAPTLLIAREFAGEAPWALRDLGSRLAAMGRAAIDPFPDEDFLEKLLAARLRACGVRMGEGVGAFVVRRLERDFAAVDDMVRAAAAATLAKGRALTIPIAREILAERSPAP